VYTRCWAENFGFGGVDRFHQKKPMGRGLIQPRKPVETKDINPVGVPAPSSEKVRANLPCMSGRTHLAGICVFFGLKYSVLAVQEKKCRAKWGRITRKTKSNYQSHAVVLQGHPGPLG